MIPLPAIIMGGERQKQNLQIESDRLIPVMSREPPQTCRLKGRGKRAASVRLAY